jgi:hypothetical protein
MKELWGVRNGLTKPGFSQSSLKPFVLSFYALDHSMLCNMLVGDLEYEFIMQERSPTLILVPVLFERKAKEGNKQGLYRPEHRVAYSLFIYEELVLRTFYYYYYFIIILLFVH